MMFIFIFKNYEYVLSFFSFSFINKLYVIKPPISALCKSFQKFSIPSFFWELCEFPLFLVCFNLACDFIFVNESGKMVVADLRYKIYGL